MKSTIINNLFGFWKHTGFQGQFLKSTELFECTSPKNHSWPSKIFELKEPHLNINEIYTKVKNGIYPNSVSLLENPTLEARLVAHNFMLKSTVKGMYLNLENAIKPQTDFHSIAKVDTVSAASEFARIASLSFSCEVLPSTISSLIDSPQLKLFIGGYKSKYVSCGLVFEDDSGISGLHMIGTISKYRGLGLGKIMTNKLLFEAFENNSSKVVLVASKAGERIYSKLGFISQGRLRSYAIKR